MGFFCKSVEIGVILQKQKPDYPKKLTIGNLVRRLTGHFAPVRRRTPIKIGFLITILGNRFK